MNKDNSIVFNKTSDIAEQKTLDSVREYIINAQKQIYSAVNSSMVIACWNIGRQIYNVCGENGTLFC